MKKSKTFLTLILAAVLAMSSLQMPVYAAENTSSIIDVLLHAFLGKDDGKVRYDGHYYQFFDEGITWTEAHERCIEMGGHLVTITSREEHDFCNSLVGDLSPKYCWIGAINTEGTWGWVTGEKWDYTDWSSSQPNGSGGGQFALINFFPGIEKPGTWDDQGDSGNSPSSYWRSSPYYQTTDYYSFICEWENEDSPYTKPATYEKMKYNEHYYQFFDEGITWTEAYERCKEMGGHLVTITSREEHDFCNSLVGSLSPKYCWIGAINTEGRWGWINGEKWDYTGWSKTQPNGSGGGHFALMQFFPGMDIAGTWDDQGDSGNSPSSTYKASPYYQITSSYSFICEWD